MTNDSKSLRDTQTEVKNRHTLFTDGNNYANVLVRELFIHEDDLNSISGRLKVVYARKETTSRPYHSIVLADTDSYDPSLQNYTDRFVAYNWDTDLIKFTGYGAFDGKSCYMIADWETVWELCSDAGLVNNSEIRFNAYVDENVVIHMKFSPTLATYLEPNPLRMENVEFPSVTGFTKEVFELGAGTYQEVNAATASELTTAISGYSKVIINLTADIKTNGIIAIPNNKTVIINGNGHRIFEAGIILTSSSVANGARKASFTQTPNINTAFNAPDGTMLLLEKSEVFQSNCWHGSYLSSTFHFSIDNSITPDTDNVYVSYGLQYVRRSALITGWSNNLISFAHDPNSEQSLYNSGISNYTPKPYFFLSNYGKVREGVLIKSNYVYWPMRYKSIYPCTLANLIQVGKSGKLELNNVIISGATNYTINNAGGEVRLIGCKIENKIGGGILSTGKVFVSNCIFSDILGNGVYADYNSDDNNNPYVEVTNCIFKNIGIYGSNVFGVDSKVKGYIAHSKFIDTNYGAIRIGNISTSSETEKNACKNLVEHNLICYTPDWMIQRKRLGLQDSGAIYVATNNNIAIVRYNKILGAGGSYHLKGGYNRGIFCDDGAYNVTIYCNIIAHTEKCDGKNYDIDSRDFYGGGRLIPLGETYNSNNYISYNVCNGWLKLQEYGSSNSGSTQTSGNCTFDQNIIASPSCYKRGLDMNVINGSIYPYTTHTPIVYDRTGYIDMQGNIVSEFDYYSNLGLVCV